ncbi:MAG: hypothetical protein U1E70_21155 [Acetobacteraceae bacterium]|nr:hypothetical protein [Pseudomonadota bacterium]
MSETLALPPRLVVRDLLLTAATQKGRVILICFCVMAIALAAAVIVKPDYKAKSSLLVLMGTEHTFRPAAGQQFMNSGGVDAEQILRTESGIMGSDDLHRSVIREIGIGRLYPDLLKPPTLLQSWYRDARRLIAEWTGTGKDGAALENDPMAQAVELFARNLTITVDKKSSVIGLEFTNPDAAVSAEALRVLEAQYFNLRAKLYGDVQAPIVRRQQDAVAEQLSAANKALEQFKQQHDISNFADRRTILLRQQGDLEAALAKSEATVAGLQARLEQLNQQFAAVAGNRKNASAALQSMVNAYRQRQEEAATTYRGSPAVDEARRQAMERQTDIARMQATQAYGVETDRNKTDADMRAAVAGRDAIQQQLTSLKSQIDALNNEEMSLHRLELNRAILEDNYRAVTKILDERQVVETVEANRESSVRVIQPPREPALPQPTRRLILLAGVVVSMLLSVGSILLAHFFRSTYLRPEALEVDTGLTVLAAVPEMPALRGGGPIMITAS